MALGGATARSISVRLSAQVGEYLSNIGRARAVTGDFRRELAETAADGKGNLDAVANGAIAMGTAILAAVGGVVVQGAKFEHAMAQVKAVSGATADEFESMRRAAIDMGATTVFSASEAANATEELAKAGLSAADITGGALAGALSLAAAGGLGLAEAASIAAGAMSAFNLEASEMGRVADVLTAGANRSNTTVSELGQALSNVGVVAAQAGFGIDETVGALMALADNTVTSAEAGTNLRTTLLRLLAPTDQAKARMDELGIAVYKADGTAKSMVDIVSELENGLRGMTEEQRAATLQLLFGQRAIVGANILLKEGADGIADYIDKAYEMGIAAETAGARLDSLQGDLQLMRSALEGLAIDSSGAATGGLRMLTQVFTTMLGQLNDLPAPLVQAGVVLAALTGAALLAGGALLKLSAQLTRINAQLAAMGPAGQKAAGALAALAKWGGIVAGVFLALQVADAVYAQFQPAAADVDLLTASLMHLAETGENAGESVRLFGSDFSQLGYDLKAFQANDWFAQFARGIEDFPFAGQILADFAREVNNLVNGTNFKSFAQSAQDIGAFDAAMAQVVQSGNAEEVRLLLARIAEENPEVSYEALAAAMPQTLDAISEFQSGMAELQERTSITGGEMEVLADRFGLVGDNAVEAIGEMLGAWSEAATDFVSLTGAFNDALAELDENATMTADNFIEQLRKQVEAQEQWASNMEELAGKVPEAMLDELARLGPEAAEMVALMAGMTEEELAEVIDLWERSGQASGDAIADGILTGTKAAQEGVDELGGAIDGLPDGHETEFDTPGLRPSHEDIVRYDEALRGVPRESETEFLTPGLDSSASDVNAYTDDVNTVPTQWNTFFATPGIINVMGGVSSLTSVVKKVPASRNITFGLPNIGWATSMVNGLRTALSNIPSFVSTQVHTNHTSSGKTAGHISRRWGGVTHHAQTGLLRDARVFSPVAPARFAFAEPATRGEAFIPRVGDRQRSLGILSEAAGWYGAQIVPSETSGMRQSQQWAAATPGSAPIINVHVMPAPALGASEQVMNAIVQSIQWRVRHDGGGDVQAALGTGNTMSRRIERG